MNDFIKYYGTRVFWAEDEKGHPQIVTPSEILTVRVKSSTVAYEQEMTASMMADMARADVGAYPVAFKLGEAA